MTDINIYNTAHITLRCMNRQYRSFDANSGAKNAKRQSVAIGAFSLRITATNKNRPQRNTIVNPSFLCSLQIITEVHESCANEHVFPKLLDSPKIIHTMVVDLGFVEKCESWRLESKFFPSKTGGKPAWLNLKSIPGKSDLQCEYCGDPCIFLCQIYAPYEENANAFHRTVYIFICKNVDCCRPNQNGNLKVFRSQLNKINTFYPSDPPVEWKDWRTDIDVSQWAKTCCICGISAPSHCAKCKIANYCSRVHQVYDWKNGHKNMCNIKINNSNSFLFPEYEIVIESDDSVKENIEQDDYKSEQKEIEKYNVMIQNGQAGTFQHKDVDNDLLQMASDEKDETFAQFRTKIDNYPDQVLRYDRGGKILYISSHNQLTDVPKCPECNGDRQFEFQIMPQLLNFLNLKDVNCLDWGILAIFTCKQSCVANDRYIKEYIWKQDIVQDT